MDQTTVNSLRAQIGRLYETANEQERQVLDLLLAIASAVDIVDEGEVEVEGFSPRRRFGLAVDPRSRDRLGNFEIQDLMSRYNQAEQLASSVQKKQDDTLGGIIGKI